jgi:hypothetical protein
MRRPSGHSFCLLLQVGVHRQIIWVYRPPPNFVLGSVMCEHQCPICNLHNVTPSDGSFDHVDCERCKGVDIDGRLVRAPETITNWSDLLGAARELRVQHDSLPLIRFNGAVVCPGEDGRLHEITRFPGTIQERAHKLLSSLVKLSKLFGEELCLTVDDYPLAYARTAEERIPFIEYLQERGLLRINRNTNSGNYVVVTADGIEAFSDSQLLPAVRVFLSSTCYDLRDCRAELASHLQ